MSSGFELRRSKKALGRLLRLGGSNPARPSVGWLARNKDSLAALQSIFTIGALIVAAMWFYGTHASNEKITTKLRVSSRPFRDGQESLLGVELWAINVGQTPVYLGSGRVAIDEINPAGMRLYECWFGFSGKSDDCFPEYTGKPDLSFWNKLRSTAVLGWLVPLNSASWLEPGESSQVWARKFRFSNETKTIQIVSAVQALRTGVWSNLTSFADLERPTGQVDLGIPK